MALSEWPKHLQDDDDDPREVVRVTFETEMFVAVVTEKAVGLKEDETQHEVDLWLPVSQVRGKLEKGDWIDGIEIPKWLAEEKNLEYEE